MAFQVYAALILSLVASASAQSIWEIAQQTPQLSGLVGLLSSSPEYSAIVALLNDTSGSYTLFAPNNSGIPGGVSFTPAHVEYHLVPGTYLASYFVNTSTYLPTFLTNATLVNLGGLAQRLVVLNDGLGALTVHAGQLNPDLTVPLSTVDPNNYDIIASNGVIHIVDQFLFYPNRTVSQLLATVPDMIKLLSFVAAEGLAGAVDTTPSITLFAPKNTAFLVDYSKVSGLLGRILRNHVVGAVAYSDTLFNGQVLTTLASETISVEIFNDGLSITIYIYNEGQWTYVNVEYGLADVLLPNGVLHVISGVITVKPSSSASLLENMFVVGETFTLLGVLLGPDYTALATALNTTGSYTLFVPDNESSNWGSVNLTDINATTDTLNYHVMPNQIFNPASLQPNYVSSIYFSNLKAPLTGINDDQRILIYKDATSKVLIKNGLLETALISSPNQAPVPVVSSNGVFFIVSEVLLAPPDMTEAMRRSGCSNMYNYLERAGLEGVADLSTNLTILVPTDQAWDDFCALNPDLCSDSGQLDLVLLNQWFSGDPEALYTPTLTNNQFYAELGRDLPYQATYNAAANPPVWSFCGLPLVESDILTQNGVMHIVDGFLFNRTCSPVVPEPDQPSSSSGLSAGEVVAICAGIVVAIAIIYFIFKTVKKEGPEVPKESLGLDNRGNKYGTLGEA